eukprot:jgi/Tetstr1/460953/TSEL_006105.t1
MVEDVAHVKEACPDCDRLQHRPVGTDGCPKAASPLRMQLLPHYGMFYRWHVCFSEPFEATRNRNVWVLVMLEAASKWVELTARGLVAPGVQRLSPGDFVYVQQRQQDTRDPRVRHVVYNAHEINDNGVVVIQGEDGDKTRRGANAPPPVQRGGNAPRPGQRGANAPRSGQRGANVPQPGRQGANAPRPGQRGASVHQGSNGPHGICRV